MERKNLGMILGGVILITSLLTACGVEKGLENASHKGEDVESSEQSETEIVKEIDFFRTLDTVDLNGERVQSSIFAENKVTFVNLWNIGCTPCVQEIPILNQLNDEYKELDLGVKGLYFSTSGVLGEEERLEIQELLEEVGADYQQITISEEMLKDELIQSIQAFPTTFVVDEEGNILGAMVGARDYDGWKDVMDSALEVVNKDE